MSAGRPALATVMDHRMTTSCGILIKTHQTDTKLSESTEFIDPLRFLSVNSILRDNVKSKVPKNRARENRKTLKRPKMMSKLNFRNLKLKSHEEYLIYRTHFVFQAKSQS